MRNGDAHDRKLYHAVREHKPLGDGLCQVYTDNSRRHLRVTVYGAEVFFHDNETGYWEISDGGHRHPWIIGKMNACLSGINAPVRTYWDERTNQIMVTNATQTVGRGNKFNWRTYNVK